MLTLLGVAAFAPFVLQLAGRADAPTSTMIGAGLGFAWSGLVNQFVADAAQNGHWGTAISWAVGAAAAALVGLTCEMSALQRRPAILVAPVVFVVQTLIPVLLAPLWSRLELPRLAAVGRAAARLPVRAARRRDRDRALAGAAGDQRRPRPRGAAGRAAAAIRPRARTTAARRARPTRARRRAGRARRRRRASRSRVTTTTSPRLKRRAGAGVRASSVTEPRTGMPPAVRASSSWPTVSPAGSR